MSEATESDSAIVTDSSLILISQKLYDKNVIHSKITKKN